MIAAANGVAFHPTERKLGAAMRATKIHDADHAVAAAIDCEFLPQDLDRLRLSGPQVTCTQDRMPEQPKIPAGRRTRSDPLEIGKLQSVRGP